MEREGGRVIGKEKATEESYTLQQAQEIAISEL